MRGGAAEVLAEVARELDSARPVVERLTAVAQLLTDALEAERSWICRVEGACIRTLAGVAMVLAHPSQPPLPLGKGVVGRAVRERRSQRVDDAIADPDYYAATALTRSELVAPILAGERVVGVINLEANRLAAFGAAEQALVEAAAALLAPHLPAPADTP